MPPSGIPSATSHTQQIHGPQGPQQRDKVETTPPPVKPPGTEAQLQELVHDRAQIQQALVRVHLPHDDLQFFNSMLDKVADHQYKPSSEDMGRLKQIVARSMDKLNGRPQVTTQHIHAAAKQVVQQKGIELADVIKEHPELKNVTRKSFGPFKLKQNTKELTATRERLKNELVALEKQTPPSPDAIRLKKAELYLVEKAIIKRTDARLPELGSQLNDRVDSLSSRVAQHFVAEHGSKFTLGFFGRRDAAQTDKLRERLETRENVLRDMLRSSKEPKVTSEPSLDGIKEMFTRAEREAAKKDREEQEEPLDGVNAMFTHAEREVAKIERENQEEPLDGVNAMFKRADREVAKREREEQEEPLDGVDAMFKRADREVAKKDREEQDVDLDGIDAMFTRAEREAAKLERDDQEVDLDGIKEMFAEPTPTPREEPSRLRADMTSNPTGQNLAGDSPFDPLENVKKGIKEGVKPLIPQIQQELQQQVRDLQDTVQHRVDEVRPQAPHEPEHSTVESMPSAPPLDPTLVEKAKVVADQVQEVAQDVASVVSDAVSQVTDVVSPMVLPDADAVLTKGTKGSVRLTGDVERIGGSDWNLTMGLKYSWDNTNEVLTGRGCTKHVRNKGVGGDVAVKGLGITFGVGGGRGTSSIFLRQVREHENPETLRTSVEPPTIEDVGKDPVRALKQVGDTAIFSTHMDIRASVGYVDPTGFHVSATASYANEYRIGVQRHGGDPPSFRVRLEPESNAYTGDVSTGWGPFSVTGGGGKNNAVFYEFEMTETALQDTLRSGKFPVVPNLQTYLDKGTKFTPEMFAAFDQVNDQAGGIRLVEFGAQKGTEGHVEASVLSGAIARVRGQVRNEQELVLTRGEAVLKTSHTTSIEVSALLKGSRTEANHQAHFFSSKVSADGQSMERTYACMMGSYRLTDTESDRADIEKRMVKINQLLGRTGDNAIRVPPQGQLPVNFARATASLSVNVTREHLQTLAALNLDDRDTDVKLRAVAFSTGLEPADLLQLVKDLQPRAIERANPEMLREDVLRLENTTREEQILALQGARVAELLDSKGLQGLAALDRLLGGNVASFSLTSNAYDQRLNDLAIQDFKPKTGTGDVWASFQELAAKRSVVLELQAGLDGPDKDLVTPQEHADLKGRIAGHLELLADLEAKMMATPGQRQALMTGLASRDGLGIGSPETQGIKAMIASAVLGERGDRLDTIGTSIETLLQKAADPAEQAAQLDLLLKGTNGRIGIPQTLALFARAHADGTLDQVLNGIKSKRFEPFATRLSDEERVQFLADCGPSLSAEARQFFETGKTKVEGLSQQHIGAMKPLMEAIIARVPAQLDLGGKEAYDLVDIYKPLARDFRSLRNLDEYIRKDPMLTRGDHDHVADVGRAGLDTLEARLQTIGTDLTETQRADLFKHLLSPRFYEKTGRASHELMDRLIKVDAANPQQRQQYIAAMLANVDAEGGLVFSGLQALQEAAPQALTETLRAITPEQLVAMAKHPDVDELALLDMVIKQGSPKQVQALRETKPEFTQLESEFKDLKATLDKRRDWGDAWKQRKLAEYQRTKAEMRAHSNQPTLPGQGLVPSAEGFMAMGRAIVDALTPSQVTAQDVRDHDLKHFQELAGLDVELRNAQGKLKSSTLPPSYLKDLDTQLQAASARTRSKLGELSRMAPEDRQAMLTTLVAGKFTPQNQTLIGSLIAEARKDPAELTACTEILFNSAGTHGAELMQLLGEMDPQDRKALVGKLTDEQLKAWAKPLGAGERKTLMAQLQADATPAQMERIRRTAPGYKDALAALEAIPKDWQAQNLAAMDPYDQVTYLKEREKASAALQQVTQALTDLGDEYMGPHADTLNTLKTTLQAQGPQAMSALTTTQKEALFTALANPKGMGTYIGPTTRPLMDGLIADAGSDRTQLNAYAKLLSAAPVDKVREQLAGIMTHLAPSEKVGLLTKLVGATDADSKKLVDGLLKEASANNDLGQLRAYADAFRAGSLSDVKVDLLRTMRAMGAVANGGEEALADLLVTMSAPKSLGRSSDLTNFATLLDRTQIIELIELVENSENEEIGRALTKLQKQLLAKS